MKHFISFLLTVLVTIAAVAQNNDLFAPLNPDFEKYINAKKSGKAKELFPYGYIPTTVAMNFDALEHLSKDKKNKKSFPTRYDLRTEGFVTPVKDQKQVGACWAFAAIGALETRWLKEGWGYADLSEKNMATCHGFDWGFDDGGNHLLATAYLTRFEGPVQELYDGYVNNKNATCTDYQSYLRPAALISEARFIPKDIEALKEAIMEYGAVSTIMHAGTFTDPAGIADYYNQSDYTFYYDGARPVDHGVLIVGWDDEKVVTGGEKSPKGTKGAWIVKNSWSTSFGEGGYFYASYNDTKFGAVSAYFPTMWKYDSDLKIHMYDELGGTMYRKGKDNVGYGLIKFHVQSEEFVNRIGTYINTAGTIIDVEIYDKKDGNDLTGLLGTCADKVCIYPGYYTFDVSATVTDSFYVKVKYFTPGYDYPVPIEKKVEDFATPAIQSNTCWISNDALTWQAVGADQGENEQFDLCIRAYAKQSFKPVAYFAADKEETCVNSSVVFSENSYRAGDSYAWNFGKDAEPETATGKGPHTVSWSSDGKKEVSLIVSGAGGVDTLIRSDYINVVTSLDVFTPYGTIDILMGDTATLFATNADTYSWTPTNGLFSTEGAFVKTTTTTETTYTVTGKMGTCSGTATVKVVPHPTPENDDVCNAIELSAGINGTFSNEWAGVQKYEPMPDTIDLEGGNECNTQKTWCQEGGLQNSVWFKFTAGDDFTWIDTRNLDIQIAIYDAQTCNDILSNDTSKYKIISANDDWHPEKEKYAAAITDLSNLTKGKQYWLQVDGSAGGEEGDFLIILPNWPVNVPELESQKDEIVKLYPNPTEGVFLLIYKTTSSKPVFLKIINMNGQIIYNEKSEANITVLRKKINLSNYPAGIYNVQILDGTNYFNKKIIKKD